MRWKRRLLAGLVPLLLLCLAAAAAFRPWPVTPPPAPQEPAVVFVADYGLHSRLALQIDSERMVEYGFGDWRYYALGESGLRQGAAALLLPTEAALGRRPLPLAGDAAAFNRASGAIRSSRIQVEREKLEDLRDSLARRYAEGQATEVRFAGSALSFVKEEGPYHLFHNSNHQTAAWLRSLGCDAGPFTILSNFRLRERSD